MLQRFLDPKVLSTISSLDLVAKTVVDGFIAGLHRSPDFGFSQEFAEYRAYTQGDDLRHVDWNVFARTERCYLKRFHGETNCTVTLMLDASASMTYSSHGVTKLDFARYLVSSIAYLAHRQRDAAGVIAFDDEVRQYVPPSGRHGQLVRILHAVERAEGGSRTDFARPFLHFMQFLHRRGIVVVVSDLYEDADKVIRAIEPLRMRGNEVMLFHILDPQELNPQFSGPMVLEDLETGESMEVSAQYARTEYKEKIDTHIESLKSKARGAGMDYFLADTSRPLDASLREYLLLRQGRL